MKKSVKIILYVVGGIILLSIIGNLSKCGSDSDDSQKGHDGFVVSPVETEVGGDLGDCYTVVDKKYKLVNEDYGYKLFVELERTDAELPFEVDLAQGDNPTIEAGFGIEALDKDGNVLDKVGPFVDDDAKDLLKLKPGKKASYEINIDEKIALKIAGFRVISKCDKNNLDALTESDEDLSETVEAVSDLIDAEAKAVKEVSKLNDENKADLEKAKKDAKAAAKAGKAMFDLADELLK